MCEIYCTLGAIFHRFEGLKVTEDFGSEDLEVRELLIGYHPKGARKLKLLGKNSL
jgi:hypothetical protein